MQPAETSVGQMLRYLSCAVSSYGLEGALAILIKEDMAPHLPEIVTELMSSIKSTEGITVAYFVC